MAARRNNNPINLPTITIFLIILLGLAVVIGLVQIPQIFKSRADSAAIKFSGEGVTVSGDTYTTTNPTVQVTLTSPYTATSSDPTTNAQPIFTDNMDDSNPKLGTTTDARRISNYNWHQTYQNGTYEILIVPGDGANDRNSNAYYITSVYKKDSDNEFTAIFDAKLTGEGQGGRGLGLTFGSQKEFCDFGSADCFEISVYNDKFIRLYYQEANFKGSSNPPVYKIANNFDLKEGSWYTYRVDRKLDYLKVWVKPQQGGGWQQIADTSLNSNNGRGKRIGFYVSKYDTGISVRGNFDNLKVYKLGDLSEPNSSLQYRYSADAASINSDPNGDKVKWQAMTSNPITIPQTFSSDAGTKYFFAQFKNGSTVSQVFTGTITLGSGGATVPTSVPGQSYSACGKSGTLGQGYTPLTTCNDGTYLVVDQYGSTLEPSCRAIPPGFTRDPNDVCKVVSSTQTVSGNVCLTNPGYMCGDANGKTRSGKNCSGYQASLNAGCASDNVYPYCFNGCN